MFYHSYNKISTSKVNIIPHLLNTEGISAKHCLLMQFLRNRFHNEAYPLPLRCRFHSFVSREPVKLTRPHRTTHLEVTKPKRHCQRASDHAERPTQGFTRYGRTRVRPPSILPVVQHSSDELLLREVARRVPDVRHTRVDP